VKKTKKVIISLFLISAFLIFLVKYYFSSSTNEDSQVVETTVESTEQSKEIIDNEIINPPVIAEPFVNVKPQEVSAAATAVNEFTADELKKIENMRSEAKMSLAANYTALMSFHAEWDRYTTDLKSMGFAPYRSELIYKLGFIKQFQPSEVANQNTNEDFNSTKNLTTDAFIGEKESQSGKVYRYAPELNNINLDEYSKYCQRGCTATDKEFEILLVLPLLNSGKVDVWIINEKKEIIQVLDGAQ
jgi:hypothetical protein